jgi:hypothetical protein
MPNAYLKGMAQPLVVSIPHRLGRDEAVRRIKSGLDAARAQFAHLITISEGAWEDNRVSLQASALGQVANAVIDVQDDHVQVAVQLPWLLVQFAKAAAPLIERQGTLMLEKK